MHARVVLMVYGCTFARIASTSENAVSCSPGLMTFKSEDVAPLSPKLWAYMLLADISDMSGSLPNSTNTSQCTRAPVHTARMHTAVQLPLNCGSVRPVNGVMSTSGTGSHLSAAARAVFSPVTTIALTARYYIKSTRPSVGVREGLAPDHADQQCENDLGYGQLIKLGATMTV